MTSPPPFDAPPPPDAPSRVKRVLLGAYLGAFVIVTGVWIAAPFLVSPGFPYPPPKLGWSAKIGHSAIHFRHWSAGVPTTQAANAYVRGVGPNAGGSSGLGRARLLGLYAEFSGYHFRLGTAHAYREVAVHYYVLWWATLPAALLVARAYLQHRYRRRAADTTLCPTCGYDCRATPERCPECGNTL